jgi:hypothetical protein
MLVAAPKQPHRSSPRASATTGGHADEDEDEEEEEEDQCVAAPATWE